MIADVVQTGLGSWWAPVLAFLAGLVSVASPCVWPLIPGYVSFISGGAVEEDPGAPRPLLPILLFILGFTIVFALLGAFASTFVALFKGTTGQRVAGLVVIVLGLLMIGYAFQKGSIALYTERRPFLQRVKPGTVGALPLGMAFAAGWTPCIGPVLGGILAIAASGSTARGVFLLVCYSLGLGVPFLLVSFGFQVAMRAFAFFRRRARLVTRIGGAMLICVGLLEVTGAWSTFMAWLQTHWVSTYQPPM